MFQTVIVLGIIVFAAAYVGARFLRAARAVRRKDEGCGSGCGCSDAHGDLAHQAVAGSGSSLDRGGPGLRQSGGTTR